MRLVSWSSCFQSLYPMPSSHPLHYIHYVIQYLIKIIGSLINPLSVILKRRVDCLGFDIISYYIAILSDSAESDITPPPPRPPISLTYFTCMPQGADLMLLQCWATVCDAAPALKQHQCLVGTVGLNPANTTVAPDVF